ncbi:MAG: hypothetical protein EOO92_18120 [Pedobacter sp.]|nr:MAG: hypothetical protein EOO92_18120 [Pedobacter sp.]
MKQNLNMETVQAIKQRFEIIGNDPKLNRAIEKAIQVAPTDISVMVTGESGVGKENIPRIIHSLSHRKHGKYIAVNCGAIPEGTIDSELFGHEKGAFTGATSTREGYFEVADGGTIFLDEVGELPLTTQVRLLRVLENGEFIKVGSSQVQKTNVRIVAATNVNLFNAIEKGKFREDLYYRLTTVEITLPPLRERNEDIHLLFRKFVADFAHKYKMPPIKLEDDAVATAVGRTVQLKAIITPGIATNQAVTWATSDPNVATVSDAGLVTGVKAGAAFVTVTTVDGGKTATCSVIVTTNGIPVSSVSIPASISLQLDKTAELKAVVLPETATDKSVTWKSDKPSVATVSATGVVTAKAYGVAIITVTTNDGFKTATCEVSVEKENLLKNNGFESGFTNWERNWGAEGTDVVIVNTPEFVYRGNSALKVGPGESGRGQIVKDGVVGGASYTLTGWCKVVGTGNSVFFEVMCFNSAGERMKDTNGPGFISTDWNLETYTFVTPPETTEIHVLTYNNAGMTLYTDEWKLTKD